MFLWQCDNVIKRTGQEIGHLAVGRSLGRLAEGPQGSTFSVLLVTMWQNKQSSSHLERTGFCISLWNSRPFQKVSEPYTSDRSLLKRNNFWMRFLEKSFFPAGQGFPYERWRPPPRIVVPIRAALIVTQMHQNYLKISVFYVICFWNYFVKMWQCDQEDRTFAALPVATGRKRNEMLIFWDIVIRKTGN